MSRKWEVRGLFDYDGDFSPDDRREIERSFTRWMEGAKSPLPAEAEVACVEVVEDCPCCEMPESWCHCTFQARVIGPNTFALNGVRHATWCLDHDREVQP